MHVSIICMYTLTKQKNDYMMQYCIISKWHSSYDSSNSFSKSGKKKSIFPKIQQFYTHSDLENLKKSRPKNWDMEWINFTDFSMDIFHFIKVFKENPKYSKIYLVKLIYFNSLGGLCSLWKLLLFSGENPKI